MVNGLSRLRRSGEPSSAQPWCVAKMGLYRRVARSKKGMSTVFGGLFFVILILMGFNVMLWGFVQWDAYNRTISNMSQRDQQAISENIIPVNATCNSSCKAGTGTLNMWVNNLGGESVTIDTVYLFDVNGTGTPCSTAPCIASPTGGTGNIPAGSVNFPIQVNNLAIGSYSYHIVLASSRGRLFSLYFPWRFNSLIINNNGGPGGNFVTNIGPLAIYFDSKSFNYTQGSSGACSGVPTSCSAFCMPNALSLFYIRVKNTSPTYNVTLLPQTAMQMQLYGSSNNGQTKQAFIMDSSSVNPSTYMAYSTAREYVLQPDNTPGGVNPSSFAIVKFGSASEMSGSLFTFPSNGAGNFLTFIGIYYMFNGQPQGQTIPFMNFDNNPTSLNPITCTQ
jgi:hypothetical protein